MKLFPDFTFQTPWSREILFPDKISHYRSKPWLYCGWLSRSSLENTGIFSITGLGCVDRTFIERNVKLVNISNEFQISRVPSTELNYQDIDDIFQNSSGVSYDDLILQHSFNLETFYAQDEKDRLELLSINTARSNSAKSWVKQKKVETHESQKLKAKHSNQKKEKVDTEKRSPFQSFLIELFEIFLHVVL